MSRVLIIDDSPTLIASLSETLVSAGYEVDSLSSFLDLPDKVRNNPPHLILLDLDMPMMPGRRAAEYIRKYQEQPIPILIHSSAPPEELIEATKTAGAQGFLPKGSAKADLLRKIATTIEAGSIL